MNNKTEKIDHEPVEEPAKQAKTPEPTEEEKQAIKNLELWNSVCTTDPDYVKEVSYGSRKFSTVDAYWRLREATALWGPYGAKWGLKNMEHKFIGEDQKTCILHAVFFYPGGQFETTNSIVVGQDFMKKLETDTLTKAMSKIGFSADVFMGQFDDERYVTEQRKARRLEEKKAILIYTMKKYRESIDAIKDALAEDDLSSAAEIYVELGMNDVENEDAKVLWVAPTICRKNFDMEGPFTTNERNTMKSDEFMKHVRDFLEVES